MKQAKYTLIELMVAMGVFSLMMTLLMSFFGQSTDVLGRESSRAAKLYEGGTFSIIANSDLKYANDSVAGTFFYYGLNSENNPTLRFFSTGRNSDGVFTGELMAISYVFVKAENAIYRFADLATSTNTMAGFDTFETNKTGAGADAYYTNGSILMEGVERFDLMIYSDAFELLDMDGNAATMVDSTGKNLGVYVTEDDINEKMEFVAPGTAATDKGVPDLISFTITLNDREILEVAKGLADPAKENLLLQRRRVVRSKVQIGYR